MIVNVEITVFTPTYNRAYIINRLYESLQRQEIHNFEWLVVDDGSVDETEELFRTWMNNESKFPIRYYKKKNGGKCRAINFALDLAKGKLFFVVDSDDYLTDDALKKIIAWEKSLPKDEKYCGVAGNLGMSSNFTPNTLFETDYYDGTLLDRYRNIDGERALAFFTEIHKKYRYPEYSGEKFMTEAVIYNRMANDGYKMRFYNDIVWIYEYRSDGLTKAGNSLFLNNPIIANNVEAIFQKGLSANELKKMKVLVMIMTFNSALSFPNSVFSSMITANEKYIFRKLVDMFSTVLAPLANLVALYLGYASVGMATAATVVQFLMLPVNIYYCLRKLHIKPVIEKLPIALIKEMLGFSVFVFIGSIVDMLFWATDKVILGMLSGSVAVAIYNVGGTFNNMVMNLSTSISGVLTPRVTGMVVKDASKDELTNLFIRVGRLQFIVIALIVSGFTAFGQAFITLWAGKDYHDAYWVAILTMFPLCVPLIQNIGLTIVTAQNKHQFRSIIYMIIAILNVVTTYIAVPYCGILGAATCSCFAYILGQGIVMNIYYYKVTGLDIPLFWKNILKMAIVPGIMMFSGLLINRIYEIDNWIIFLIGIIVFTGIYIVLMYEVSFNEYERSIFREPLKRIIKRIKG